MHVSCKLMRYHYSLNRSVQYLQGRKTIARLLLFRRLPAERGRHATSSRIPTAWLCCAALQPTPGIPLPPRMM